MPRGGHNRKPTSLKVIQGTARPDRMRNEPKPEPIAPKCPKHLPPEAKREWRRLAPRLEKLGLLTALDGDALADLCLCLVRLREAEKDIAERGLLVPGKHGLQRNPSIITAKEYRQALQRWGDRFGLAPAPRGGIDLPAQAEEDEFEEFLRRGTGR